MEPKLKEEVMALYYEAKDYANKWDVLNFGALPEGVDVSRLAAPGSVEALGVERGTYCPLPFPKYPTGSVENLASVGASSRANGCLRGTQK